MKDTSMRLRTYQGRKCEDIPLPGDEEGVINNMIRTAIRRDEWFNRDELVVFLCTRQRLTYGECLLLECPYCGGEDSVGRPY